MNAQRSFTLYPLEHAIQEGRYRDALLLLEKLLDVVPEHIEAQQQYARLHVLMNHSADMREENTYLPLSSRAWLEA